MTAIGAKANISLGLFLIRILVVLDRIESVVLWQWHINYSTNTWQGSTGEGGCGHRPTSAADHTFGLAWVSTFLTAGASGVSRRVKTHIPLG